MARLTENICIPMHLDAFALSPDCADGASKLAPYTQPNYVALRLSSDVIQNDVLEHVDFHLSSSSTKNLRLQDLGSKDASIKLPRLGVHLHWSVPRFYRSAVSRAQKSTPPQDKDSVADQSQPSFSPIPNRWLVIRDLQSSEPHGVLPTHQGWIIESDVVRQITEIPGTVDLESDATPFVSYTKNPSDSAPPESQAEPSLGQKFDLKTQAEIFLGQKFDLDGWSEQKRRRMALTVMNSSNPLFPDYALHNTNVLSMIDNFQYNKTSNVIDYCTQATANYYVLGWHAAPQDDPFDNVSDSLGNVLSQLRLKLDTSDAGAAKDSKLPGSVRCLSHGAIYGVVYNRAKKPTSLADQAAAHFTKAIDMEPLAVGTTTIDAILTFLKAHRANDDSFFKFDDPPADDPSKPAQDDPTKPPSADPKTPGGGTTPTESLPTKVANDLLQISSLMYATADEYDARLQAVDLIAQQNYAKADGGIHWRFNRQTSAGDAPIVPPDDLAKKLRALNASQARLDACERKLSSTQWNLFAEWWKFVSRSFVDGAAQDAAVLGDLGLRSRVSQLDQEYDKLDALRKSLTDDITQMLKGMAVQKASNNYFYQRLDPTLCVAGIDPGRPKDFMDILQVAEDHQLVQDTTSAKVMFKDIKGSPIALPFPTDNSLDDTAMRVLAECMNNSKTANTSLTTGYRAWGAQNPFVPLFLEWEARYYHIDNAQHDAWDVGFRASPVAPSNSQLRYFPKPLLHTDPGSQTDTRDVSGRILILPQPAFNLEATVKQVLAGTNPDMTLTPDQVNDVVTNIRNMQFISAPLSGLTNHLLTRCEGAHVKPNVRDQGQTVVPLQAAMDAGSPLRYTRAILAKIDAETALTPYGTLTDFATDNYPFKPVTQGQLIFTQLNIVDKFGQAICVPTPKPRRRDRLPLASANIYPCLSDNLTPEIRGGKLNTVVELPGAQVGTGDPGDPERPGDPAGSGTWPLCQYMQLAPSINQDARMNVAFLVPDDDTDALSPWRVATDYEQPIWGWIVINYADYGLQFFQSTGEFYQEIRMGGANNTSTGPKYIPFSKTPANVTSPSASNERLDQLIALFNGDKDYLQAFFDMINGAIGTMPFPPTDYGAYANSIVGKPLALVNIGYSLELAAPAIIAQNTLGKSRAQDPPFNGKLDPAPAFQADLESYQFPVKVGDKQRSYDGVVGFYEADNSLKGAGKTSWDKLHTYFLPDKPNKGIVSIDDNPYPLIDPHYVPTESTDNVLFAEAQKFKVRSVLVDPYTPLHVYSPILPSVALQLPAWTVQTAMKRMSAFFHLGPSLLTQDVPATAFLPPPLLPPTPTPPPPPLPPAAAAAAATASPSSVTIQPTPMPPAPPTILLPLSGHKGTWSWLQPYAVPDGSGSQSTGSEPAGSQATGSQSAGSQSVGSQTIPEPQYSTWLVDEDHGQVKFAAAPYTFVEGFLELAGNLGADVQKAS